MFFLKPSSRLFGIIAKIEFFKPLQIFINKNYVKYFKIDLSEFQALEEYKSLNELFTRKLIKKRALDDDFISPCDGLVLECGESFLAEDENFAFSIKGFTYSINELLANSFEKFELENGASYANIYLSPKDYHRYHAPCKMQILSATYSSGELFSVNIKHLKKIANLYTKNERVSLKCKVDESIFWLVFVGAQNVGKMKFNFDESIQTNAKNASNFTRNYESLFVEKGEELGNFELGSTIIIIGAKDKLKFNLSKNQNIKFGEKIANLK